MATNENLIPIPGRLHSVATEGHVSGADEIFDDSLNKDQQAINAEVAEAIGTGGSVDTRIENAIKALDATVTKTAGADGLALSVTETDGKLTSVSGSIAANTYDAYGAAFSEATRAQGAESALGGRITTLETAVGSGGSVDSRIAAAKSEIKGNATSACDTLGEAEALISAEATARQSAVSAEASRAQAAEGALQSNIEALTQSAIVIVEDHTQVSSPVANTIYREQGTNSYIDWMYYGGAWKKMAEYDNAIDAVPTKDSDNLVKSGGVYNFLPRKESFSDLSFLDEEDNTIVSFNDGHVKTKNFDSKKIVVENETIDDFVIADGTGNAILSVNKGHIKTKNFDSSQITPGADSDMGLPEYYVNAITEKGKRINSIKKVGSTVLTDGFVFFTDTHIDPAQKSWTGKLAERLMVSTQTTKAIYCGDMLLAFTNGNYDDFIQSTIISHRTQIDAPIKSVGKIYQMQGNHDYTMAKDWSFVQNEGLTYSKNHSKNLILGDRYDDMHISDSGTYYYFDNDDAKIRYIVLCTVEFPDTETSIPLGVGYGIDNEQIAWVCQVLSDKPSGYDVIFFTHVPITVSEGNNRQDDFSNMMSLIEAFQDKSIYSTFDFSEADGDILAFISGHEHIDSQTIHKGVAFITSCCDKNYPDARFSPFYPAEADLPAREIGTVYENSISHFYVDKVNKRINVTKVGFGYDRIIHTNVNSIGVGQSTQLLTSLYGNIEWKSYDWNGISIDYNASPDQSATIVSNVCSVSNGLVTGLSAGEGIVIAIDENYNSEVFYINVIN